MPSKRSTSKRLAKAITAPLPATLVSLTPDGKPVPFVVRINSEAEWGRSVKAAFEAFHLDHRNPAHWVQLTIVLADVLFGKRKRGPHRIVWQDDGLWLLLLDFTAVKRDHPDKTDTAICKLLSADKQEKFGGRYAGKKYKTILRQLQNARDPERNGHLRFILGELKTKFGADMHGLVLKNFHLLPAEDWANCWSLAQERRSDPQ
jgi:hypothetical protein